MSERDTLRDEYLSRVCEALGEYLDRGLPLRLRSDGDGDTLDVTFTLENTDTFHALLEGRTPPVPTGDTPTRAGTPASN